MLSDYQGPVTVEAFTVIFDSGRPRHGFVTCLTPAGARAWSKVDYEPLLSLMAEGDVCGRSGRLEVGGRLALA